MLFELFTQKELDKAKYGAKLPLKCEHCSCIFHRSAANIRLAATKERNETYQYCSAKCHKLSRHRAPTIVPCSHCLKPIIRETWNVTHSKKGLFFCNNSCSASFHHAHKNRGNRRSRLELYIEKELLSLYPTLEFHFNHKDAINSELDIYIPSLKLAFELNGIFHYEPIFGQDQLSKVQNNDQRKFAACIENGISLCIIDASKHTTVNDKTCKKYLDIVLQILNARLSAQASLY